MEEVKMIIKGEPRTKKNSSTIIFKNKKPMIVPSNSFLEYQDLAGYQIKNKWIEIDRPVNIKAIYYRSNKRRVDINNLHSALMDILTHYGVLKDDNCNILVSTDGSRVKLDKNNPRTEILITPVYEETLNSM